MIIKSSFKDYYDQHVDSGVNNAIVYERETSSVLLRECNQGYDTLSDIALDIGSECNQLLKNLVELQSGYYMPLIVGFCGRLYVGLMSFRLNGMRLHFQRHEDTGKMERAHGVIQSFHWAESDFSTSELNKNWSGAGCYSSRKHSAAKSIKEWFERNRGQMSLERPELFLKHGLVSFVYRQDMKYRSERAIINPQLSSFNFQQRIDSETAFQEMLMHVASLNGIYTKQPDPIRNELRAMSKGFDEQIAR